MTIVIADRNQLLNQELRKMAERRLLFALSRFESRLGRVELVVEDENGPRGGVDKVCRLSIVLHRASDVVITDQDADTAKCLARVVERGGRTVARAIDRSQRLDRSRPPLADSMGLAEQST